MTTDDIAWVQGRLRDCKYLHSTLCKCAQCLDVDVSELLAALGYESEAALKQAYPDKLRGWGGEHPKPSHYQPPDAETMHEAVLMFYGGVDWDIVRRAMGYKGHITTPMLTHRAEKWRAAHPGTSAKLPRMRLRQNQLKIKEQLKMDIDAKGLPAFCYAIGPKTGAPVKIVRGDTVMYGVRGDTLIDKFNDALGVDARMAAAMVGGVLHGWDSDYAAPVNYDDDGVYIGARKE